jgi:hypothetical protein
MVFPFEFLESPTLFPGRHARTQDPQGAIVTLRLGDHDHPTLDWPDGDESTLLVGMFLVVDFQVVNPGLEALGGVLEGQTVLFPTAWHTENMRQ